IAGVRTKLSVVLGDDASTTVFFFQAEDGIRDGHVTGVQTCALPISFARVMLADPRIVVLDEATSSVDTQTERLIQQGLRRVLHGRTSLVIAHRLSTIVEADLIVVIDAGRIVERGRHAQLMALRGAYYRLYTTALLHGDTISTEVRNGK